MFQHLQATTIKSLNSHISHLPAYAAIVSIIGAFGFIANLFLNGSVRSPGISIIDIISGGVVIFAIAAFVVSTRYLEHHTIDVPNQSLLLIPCGRPTEPDTLVLFSNESFFLPLKGRGHIISTSQSRRLEFSYYANGDYAKLSLHVNFIVDPTYLTQLGIDYLLNQPDANMVLLEQLSMQYLKITHAQEGSQLFLDRKHRHPCVTIDCTSGTSIIHASLSSKASLVNFDAKNFGFTDFIADMHQSSIEYTAIKPDGPVFATNELPRDIFTISDIMFSHLNKL